MTKKMLNGELVDLTVEEETALSQQQAAHASAEQAKSDARAARMAEINAARPSLEAALGMTLEDFKAVLDDL